MFKLADFAFYSWFVPIILWVLLPLTLSLFSMLIRGVSGGRFLSQKALAKESAPVETSDTHLMEKRLHPRCEVNSGVRVVVSDGEHLCTGIASNLSLFGLCLVDVPHTLFKGADRLHLVLKGHNHNSFTVPVRPKWNQISGAIKKIGMEIDKTPAGWAEFVHSLEQPIQTEAT